MDSSAVDFEDAAFNVADYSMQQAEPGVPQPIARWLEQTPCDSVHTDGQHCCRPARGEQPVFKFTKFIEGEHAAS